MKVCTSPIVVTNYSDKKKVRPDMLEIGCGTGLLTIPMAAHARSYVAVDASQGMIDQLQRKLARPDTPSNITPVCVMLQHTEDLPLNKLVPLAPRKFDLVLGHLILHHVPSLASFLKILYNCLKPGGWVALTDFRDCGTRSQLFHPQCKSEGVERHGIHEANFKKLMEDVGFEDVVVEVAWHMRKAVERWPGEWGAEKPDNMMAQHMDFPFLLCTGCKPRSGLRALL